MRMLVEVRRFLFSFVGRWKIDLLCYGGIRVGLGLESGLLFIISGILSRCFCLLVF